MSPWKLFLLGMLLGVVAWAVAGPGSAQQVYPAEACGQASCSDVVATPDPA